jgi:hypothetical protein
MHTRASLDVVVKIFPAPAEIQMPVIQAAASHVLINYCKNVNGKVSCRHTFTNNLVNDQLIVICFATPAKCSHKSISVKSYQSCKEI